MKKVFLYLTVGNVPRGEAGYMLAEKKRRGIVTAILFAVPLLIFFTGWIYFGTRNTVWTIIAILGCLPACKQLVGLIMVMLRPSLDRGLYERIRAHQGRLLMAYELYMTFYEKSAWLSCFAVCGRTVVMYTTDDTIDGGYIASHAREILQENGYKEDVHIYFKEKEYLERLDTLNAKYDSFHEDLPDRPDERYPGLTRDEVVKAVLLALCI